MNIPISVRAHTISYQEYLEGTLIPGIRRMQSSALALSFLSFGVIGTSIEALGSFFDTHPMDEDGHSRKRFRTAIDKLFKPISGEYETGCMCKSGVHDRYCLYKGLRCSMAHIGHPQGSIAFTTRSETKVDRTAHLVKDSQGTLILVAEDLADDFEAAWNTLKGMSSNRKTNKKVTQPFITVRSYDYHRSF